MFIIFLTLWIIYNERFTTEIFLIGLVVSLAVDLFTRKIIGKIPRYKVKTWIKWVTGGAKYLWALLVEIFRCNFAVIKLIVSPRLEPEPELHYFKTRLKTDTARVTLANSITLTPGTITCTLEDDKLCVHALDRSMGEGVEDTDFEKKLLKLEETEHDS